jgi:Ca2+/Na+ antiporter
MRLNNRH